MKSFTTKVNYFGNRLGYETPDFETNITIFENGDFVTDGIYSETSYIRSWYHQQFPNGSFGLTITVKSNIAQNYDKFDPDDQLMGFLNANLPNLQRSEEFEWPPRR